MDLKKYIPLLCLIFLLGCGEPKKYTVEIKFCDNREPITVINYSICGCKPSNMDIKTDNKAVPVYEIYDKNGNKKVFLNVC